MKITPSQLTISQLFNIENEQFFIPAYQRRYAWGDKQIVQLLEDIKMLNDNDQHFLGTILLLTETHTANINRLEVVDGQQRIISLSLLFEPIKDRFLELQNGDITRKIEGYLFCQGLDGERKNKIVLGDLDEPDYGKVLQHKNGSPTEEETKIKNQKLLNAYKKFASWVSEYSIQELNKFCFKLFNSIIIIRLDTEKAKDAYKLFETINNRGLRLSPTDIIKNFLLGHASLVGDSELNSVRSNWMRVIVSLDGIDTDDFFRHSLMYKLRRKISFAKLAGEFKRYYLTTVKEAELLPEYRHSADIPDYVNDYEVQEDKNDNQEQESSESKEIPNNIDSKIGICDYASMLANYAQTYAKIVNGEFDNEPINRHLQNLKRIESTPTYPFLLGLFSQEVEKDKIIELLKKIESFILRRHICEYRTAELDDLFPRLVSIMGKNGYEQVSEELKKHCPSDAEFKEKFATYNHKRSENRAKYILEQIEYYLIRDKGEYVLKSGNDVHLEHIIPQTISTKKSLKEFGDWITYLGEDAQEKHHDYVDRIGNYTLLAKELNLKASNNPFLAKKREYKDSNIRMTKEICHDYRTFRYKQVKERSQKLSEIAVKIWSL
jgi:uncharacterized protein with ParB-like and HNH nuclease domain